MKLKVNDKVKITKGKDSGKEGKVIQVFVSDKKVVVEGANIIKKTMRARKSGEKGQVIELSAPISVANVMLICPKCAKPTRVSMKVDGKDKKRACRQCEGIIE